jgi:hypothetical protein
MLSEREDRLLKAYGAHQKRLLELEDAIIKHRKFFMAGMAAAIEGCDWDGADIQDTAVELGLAKVEKFDPAKHSEYDFGLVDPGEDWVVIEPLDIPDIPSSSSK